jgi:DNA-directed RNA polymerase specialized sigma24 family protein
MDDRDIVAAMRASALATLAGLAGAYDKYAAPLYAYCCWLLGSPHAAAEVMRNTFVLAMTDLRGMRDPRLLCPHLYAVARDECRQRQPATAFRRPPPPGSPQAGLHGLITDTLARLDDQEREVIELTFRHGFSHADLAHVLGVPCRRAAALATQVHGYLTESLAVPIVAHTGAQACPQLSELLSEWDGGQLSLWTTVLVQSHIEECPTCEHLRYRGFHPAIVYALEPPAQLPADLRAQVIGLCVQSAGLVRTVPGELPAPARGHVRLGAVLAFAAIAIWVAAAVSVTLLTILGSHSPSSHGATTVRTVRQLAAAVSPR